MGPDAQDALLPSTLRRFTRLDFLPWWAFLPWRDPSTSTELSHPELFVTLTWTSRDRELTTALSHTVHFKRS